GAPSRWRGSKPFRSAGPYIGFLLLLIGLLPPLFDPGSPPRRRTGCGGPPLPRRAAGPAAPRPGWLRPASLAPRAPTRPACAPPGAGAAARPTDRSPQDRRSGDRGQPPAPP